MAPSMFFLFLWGCFDGNFKLKYDLNDQPLSISYEIQESTFLTLDRIWLVTDSDRDGGTDRGLDGVSRGNWIDGGRCGNERSQEHNRRDSETIHNYF
ncbi:hypothetical protein MJO28_008395 [Puccinia striiformis f. sp. tritici]|uniref:Uncharacterized protein n=1 Tax=Puccinia striiformis f. sp. tritici TaxID=168172 RepID=A0ACC0EB97_9BASI|nr:hypothetical protein MJO28_008395 [Puccinia striiformis f. sp. tritici]